MTAGGIEFEGSVDLEREIEAAAAALKNESFPAGTALFSQGEESRELFVLLEGSVRVEAGGKEVAVIDEPGAYLGEISSLLGIPRTATVVTREDSKFLVVPPEHIPSLFGHTPTLALTIARGLAQRLVATTRHLVEGGPMPSPGETE
ncbi:MAG: cyclic nucleotide-binding domain-containing protein [Thermodesulfobacteriota bacterium]|jgi:CRP-like cAMP-binding protein